MKFQCQNCGAVYPRKTWLESLETQVGISREDAIPPEESEEEEWHCPNCSIGPLDAVEIKGVK